MRGDELELGEGGRRESNEADLFGELSQRPSLERHSDLQSSTLEGDSDPLSWRGILSRRRQEERRALASRRGRWRRKGPARRAEELLKEEEQLELERVKADAPPVSPLGD